MNTGIYLIRNKTNNKIYVGSTSRSFKNRFSMHRYQLRKNEHHSPYLQKSWNKYGEENFEFIILEKCSKKLCIEIEQFYLDCLRPEFNNCTIAGSRLGSKNLNPSSEKVKNGQKERAKKLGLSNKGKKLCEEHKKIARNAAPKKPVTALNVVTGEKMEFVSQMEASRKLNIDKRYISGICRGKFKTIRNWTFTNG